MIPFEHLPYIEVFEGFKAQFIHTPNSTLGLWQITKGAVLPVHSHIHEQLTQVVEGQFELTIDGQTKVYHPGDLAIIPSNVVHSGVALTDCLLYDVFTPVREDYLKLSTNV
ncbi:MAG: cupin domain-containing protein [Runella sp.]